jgi:hypothetical protein
MHLDANSQDRSARRFVVPVMLAHERERLALSDRTEREHHRYSSSPRSKSIARVRLTTGAGPRPPCLPIKPYACSALTMCSGLAGADENTSVVFVVRMTVRAMRLARIGDCGADRAQFSGFPPS